MGLSKHIVIARSKVNIAKAPFRLYPTLNYTRARLLVFGNISLNTPNNLSLSALFK